MKVSPEDIAGYVSDKSPPESSSASANEKVAVKLYIFRKYFGNQVNNLRKFLLNLDGVCVYIYFFVKIEEDATSFTEEISSPEATTCAEEASCPEELSCPEESSCPAESCPETITDNSDCYNNRDEESERKALRRQMLIEQQERDIEVAGFLSYGPVVGYFYGIRNFKKLISFL